MHRKMRGFLQCEYCERKYSNLQYLYEHENNHRTTAKIACRYCLTEFSSKMSRLVHERDFHVNSERFYCRYCRAPFNQKRSLLKHEQNPQVNCKRLPKLRSIKQSRWPCRVCKFLFKTAKRRVCHERLTHYIKCYY